MSLPAREGRTGAAGRRRTNRCRSRRRGRAIVATASAALVALAAGCAHPMPFKTLEGTTVIYPDVVTGKPAILAFLSANDRRCDEVIPTLWGIQHRPTSPVEVVGVMVYDDFSYIREIEELRYATFPILLDPDHHLTRMYRVRSYPTFVFLSWEGSELERSGSLKDVGAWLEDPGIYERALPERPEQVPAGS